MQNKAKRLDNIYNSTVITLPNIKIVSNEVKFTQDTILHEDIQTSPFQRKEDVVLTLLLNGEVKSNYGGLNFSFGSRSRTCSFIYGPLENDHFVPGNQTVNSITIGINKVFFQGLMQHEDVWMETVLNKIEKYQPFSFTDFSYALTPGMLSLLQQINASQDLSNSMKTLYLQSKVCELILLQFSEIKKFHSVNTDHNTLGKQDQYKFHDLKAYIESHFLENLSLDDLVRLSGLNSFKLKTGFRLLYQQSVFGYIRKLRMQYASDMLLDGEYTVTEIAEILGYEYVQHFSTAFKKHFGQSPGKYKF